ncbi:hypothetical protein BDY17DRAFT_289194 [Neohortaea acidophila]|uniref:BTB domain-containing protein n=1 Tax=Neohortaea acidophila TaxID=245834 RepID=A0A6A6Q691_9PEZI|nr:uncharacterized protein BDY17DRAFT_289194 [Neohortaea acidophila]KAF2487559.1 hypothetical protein BDY17DRAFT_289194 [Neohortaea acidophila]
MSATSLEKQGNDDKPEPESVQLDEQGDVVLIVGSPATHKITVSSVMLALASPVFKAMLGSSKFREGQGARSALEPMEVFLLEDDAEAMLNICRLLYHQGQISRGMKLYHLLQTMDKYQCLETFAIPVDAMVRRELEEPIGDWEETIFFAAIAYLANDAEKFKKMTSMLITDYSRDFSDVHTSLGGETLPLNALLTMSEIRQSTQWSILVVFPTACEKDHSTPECIIGFQRWRRWLADCQTVKDFLDIVGSKTQKKGVETFRQDVEIDCSGLCLKCVKEGLMHHECETPGKDGHR